MSRYRLHPDIKKALEATNLPYEVVCGSKHNKLYLNGKFIAAMQRTIHSGSNRGNTNLIANIRRNARSMQL